MSSENKIRYCVASKKRAFRQLFISFVHSRNTLPMLHGNYHINLQYAGKANQDDVKGNLYFKIFGNELGYMDLMNLRGGSNFNILEILIKLAQNHEVEFKKSVQFLDTSMTIPTITGLPLKLSINGTATINIGLNGRMDVRRAHPSPRSVDINGNIKSRYYHLSFTNDNKQYRREI